MSQHPINPAADFNEGEEEMSNYKRMAFLAMVQNVMADKVGAANEWYIENNGKALTAFEAFAAFKEWLPPADDKGAA